jgi:hypothetical protein
MRMCLILSGFRVLRLMFFNQIAILFHKDCNVLYENLKGIFNELFVRP